MGPFLFNKHRRTPPLIGRVRNKESPRRGTTNLRMVDASVFSHIPGLFVLSPIYMIAEKPSELILADAKSVSRTQQILD